MLRDKIAKIIFHRISSGRPWDKATELEKKFVYEIVDELLALKIKRTKKHGDDAWFWDEEVEITLGDAIAQLETTPIDCRDN